MAQVEPTCKHQSEKLLYLISHSQYDSAHTLFNNEMKRLFPIEQMDGLWESLEFTFGDFIEQDEPEVRTEDTLCIVDITLVFTRSKMKLRTAWHKGLAAGLFFVPVHANYQPADYVNPSKFYELKIKTAVKGFENEGILTMPLQVKNPPVVIIVGGSGPTDKDGTLGPNKPYRDLADGLATRGIAVYRYNKRTVAYGKKMDKQTTVKEEYLDDLLSAVKQMQKHPELDGKNVFVLGHSQGGYLLPYFAKHAKQVKGFIGLAPGFKNMEDALFKQLTYLKSLSNSTADTLMYNKMLSYATYMRNHLHKNSPADSLMPGLTTNYLLHLKSVNPQNLVSAIGNKPFLVLHAQKDYQVDEEDLELWRKHYGKNPNFDAVTVEMANHAFIIVPTENAYSQPRDYELPGNVDQNVILLLESWVKDVAKK